MSPTTQPRGNAASAGNLPAMREAAPRARRRRLACTTIGAAAVLAIGVGACGGGGSDSGSGSGANKTDNVTIGVQTKILQTYYAQLAEKLGFFKQEGLKVKIIVGQDPATTVQALIGGSLDLYLGGPEALPAAVKGADLRFIAGASNRSIWDIVTTKDVHRVGDLKGKLFGVSSLSSTSTATSKQAIQAQGVSPDAVKYIVAGGTGTRYTALLNGRIQGAALGIPVNYQAADSGKLNDLGSTDGQLGAPPIAATMLTVSQKWAQGHKPIVQRFLRAYQRVIDALYDPKMTDRIVNAAAADIEVKPQYVRRAIETLFLNKSTGGKVLPKDGHIDMKALQNIADAFVSLKLLPAKIDVAKFVDTSYLKAAQASLKR
jgi:NitT/TauT family transport system substrate-binding protein